MTKFSDSFAGQMSIGLALGGLSGAMCVGCVTPHHFWPLAPLAFAPFTWACCRGRRTLAVCAGMAHGLAITIGCLSFVLPALHRMASLSWPLAAGLWALVAASQGLRAVFALLLARWLLQQFWVPLLIVPAAWVLAEWLIPVMFHWPLAVTGQGYSPWLQLAEVGGPLLVSWWMVAAGAGIGTAVVQWQLGWRCIAKPFAITAAIVSIASGLGILLERQAQAKLSVAPVVRLGVVQGAHYPEAATDKRDTLQRYRQVTLDLLDKHGDLDLVVWPEAILLGPIREEKLENFLRSYVRTDRREGFQSRVLNVPVLLGLNVERAAQAGNSYLTNSAVLFDGRGRVAGWYDKQVLMPIGETPIAISLPSLGTWELVAPVTRYQAGTGEKPLRLGDHQ